MNFELLLALASKTKSKLTNERTNELVSLLVAFIANDTETFPYCPPILPNKVSLQINGFVLVNTTHSQRVHIQTVYMEKKKSKTE